VSERVRTADFELPLPAGWSDRTAVTLAAPVASDGYAPNLVVTREPLCDHLGLGGFADGQGNIIRDHADEYAVLSTEHGEVGGERALVRVVRWRIGDEQRVMQLQAFCLHDGLAYALVGTATDSAFGEAEPAFREALAGFRFAR
jgi:hypothetical protein